MGLFYVFPEWSMEKSKKWATDYVCVQAGLFTVIYSILLVNSYMFGKQLTMVTAISISFMMSNIALAGASFLFNAEENHVLDYEFAAANKISYPFNVIMCGFCISLCLPHWFFFYQYLECCITMPYFYNKEEVPKKVTWGLFGFNFMMVSTQTLASMLVFWKI